MGGKDSWAWVFILKLELILYCLKFYFDELIFYIYKLINLIRTGKINPFKKKELHPPPFSLSASFAVTVEGWRQNHLVRDYLPAQNSKGRRKSPRKQKF